MFLSTLVFIRALIFVKKQQSYTPSLATFNYHKARMAMVNLLNQRICATSSITPVQLHGDIIDIAIRLTDSSLIRREALNLSTFFFVNTLLRFTTYLSHVM